MDKKNTKIAVVGATGVVGRVMLETLISEGLINKKNLKNLIPVASEKSVGKNILVLDQKVRVRSAEQALAEKPDYVIMSAGSGASKILAPQFAKIGATVIDNSSAWRMFPEIPLLVPSVSPKKPNQNQKIIANPNCVAIMLAVSIAPFTKLAVDFISATAMQAVSGAGMKGLGALEEEMKKRNNKKSKISPFVSNIAYNIIPATTQNPKKPDFNEEEIKIIAEVPKILGKNLKLSVQSNRVPIPHGHSANVRITFKKVYPKAKLVQMLKKAPQIKYSEKPLGPTDIVGKNYVVVRSFRQDWHNPKVYEFFTTSDNLRVGAAYNAVAIMEQLLGIFNPKNALKD